jgi:PAT family beta-lactamase induction signal transducer AmpG
MTPQPSLMQVFRNRKMGFLLLLSFSSGMPFYLTGPTLQAWLTLDGVSLTAVGLFSLVGLPYSVKFLWSPILDRFTFSRLGRRRGWMALSQVLLMGALVSMAFGRPATGIYFIAVLALVIAFLSATQDIAIDAYRTDVLERHEMGAGAGITALGYRIALILTGGGAFILADYTSWPRVYFVMAAFMLVGLAASLRAPEPEDPGEPPASLADAVRAPFSEFWNRFGPGRAVLVLSFIAFYKLGDALITNMTTPFLLQTGFTQTEIGVVQGVVGLTATIVGALAGGALLSRMGILRALWIFGLLQAGTNLLYMILAQAGHNYPLMILTITVENFCSGLGTAAFLAFLMSLCNHNFSATQYALLSSLWAFTRDVGAAPAGGMVEIMGWPFFFLTTFFVALPALALLQVLRRNTLPDTA